jgi:hypothetical protein
VITGHCGGADEVRVGIAARHPAPATLVATALFALLGMFLFARSEYRPDIPVYNIDVDAVPTTPFRM